MRQTTSALASRAAVAIRLDNIAAELNAQRTLINHLIVAWDSHEWQLKNYQPLAILCGIKRTT